MIDTALLTDYLDILDKIDSTEASLQDLKDAKKDMAAKIHSMLSAEGAGKISVRGATLSPRRTMRASAHSMPMLIEKLKAFGLDPLVKETVNAQTLTGWVNAFDPDRMCSVDELRERLPEEVREAINLYEQLEISVRR